MKSIHRVVAGLVCLSLVVSPVFLAHAETAETIDKNIRLTIYSYKKTRSYVAVEVGFTNTTNQYVSFTPQEIYLNDQNSYSTSLLTSDQMEEISAHAANTAHNFSTASLIVGAVLGVTAIGAAVGDADDAAKWLGVAALGSLGAMVVSESLAEAARDRRFVKFENNSLQTVKRLPPGITLGGFLYFAPTKKPASLSVVAQTRPGHFEKRTVALTKVKKPRKAKGSSKHSREL